MIYNWFSEKKHPRLWRAIDMLAVVLDFLLVLFNAWGHDLVWLLVFMVFCVVALWTIHRKNWDDNDRGNGGNDDESDGPNWPDGDVVNRMLYGRSKVHK